MSKGTIKRRELLTPGDLVIYPFLWSWQKETGAEVQVKWRPCVVVARANLETGPMIGLAPITTQPARDMTERLIVPYLERAEVGMDPTRPQSICVRDCNLDSVGDASHLMRTPRSWNFSRAFTKTIMREFTDRFDKGMIRIVQRTPFDAKIAPSREAVPEP